MGLPVVDNVDNIVILQSSSTVRITEDMFACGTILLIDATAQFIKQIYFFGLFASLFRFLEIIIRIMQFRYITTSIRCPWIAFHIFVERPERGRRFRLIFLRFVEPQLSVENLPNGE